jgi:hypothetical protein
MVVNVNHNKIRHLLFLDELWRTTSDRFASLILAAISVAATTRRLSHPVTSPLIGSLHSACTIGMPPTLGALLGLRPSLAPFRCGDYPGADSKKAN